MSESDFRQLRKSMRLEKIGEMIKDESRHYKLVKMTFANYS